MNTEWKFSSGSEAETEALAGRIAKRLPRGTVLALQGDLGAGKTVFARGFARGLGIEEPVSSPTYTIVQEYLLPTGGRLYHLDLYRISDARSALAFGVNEFLDDPDSLALIEWPDRIEGILPETTVQVRIECIAESVREITVKGNI